MAEVAVSLRVKDQGAGPVVYARWRDEDGGQVEKKIGPGWVVPAGAANAKRNGRPIGEKWTERAGRAPDGYLTPNAARERVPLIFAAWQEERAGALADEHREQDERAARLASGAPLREIADSWLEYEKGDEEVGWKKGTHDGARFRIGRLIRELDVAAGGTCRVEQVDAAMLRRVLRELKPVRNGKVIKGQQMKLKTRVEYAAAARALFRHAVSEGYVTESPAEGDLLADGDGVERRRRRRRVTQAEVDAELLRDHEFLTPVQIWAVVDDLLDGFPHAVADDPAVRAGQLDVQDAAMVLLGGFVGLRAGEIIALEWGAVDLVDGWLTVRLNRTAGVTDVPKGGRPRILRLEPEVLRVLKALRLRGYSLGDTNRVFIGRDGAHVDLAAFRGRFYAAQRRVGIAPCRKVHGLRHSFAVARARQGTPLGIIQAELGHSSPQMTARYRRFVRGEYDPSARISDRVVANAIAIAA
jgi:integrase